MLSKQKELQKEGKLMEIPATENFSSFTFNT